MSKSHNRRAWERLAIQAALMVMYGTILAVAIIYKGVTL